MRNFAILPTAIGLAALGSVSAEAAHAQAKTFHPKVTSISPASPSPGQFVTLGGSDLLPPTWTAKLQYHDKYGGGFHEIALNGSNTAATFTAPNNVQPGAVVIQYTNSSTTNALENPIPQTEQRLPVNVVVQEKPKIDTTSFVSVSGPGGAFHVVAPGTRTIRGQFLLGPFTISMNTTGGTTGGPISQPTLSTSVTSSSAPTTSFAGAPIGASDAKYIPTSRDEVTIAFPTAAAANTSGFFKLTTPTGSDSLKLTVVGPPQNAAVFEQFGASTPVNNGQLVRGRTYVIRGRTLAVIERSVSGGTTSLNINTPTVTLGGLQLNLLNAVAVVNSSDTLVQFNVPANANTSGGAMTLSHAGGSVALGNFTVINQPAPLQISGAVISPNDIIAGTPATITLSLTPPPTNFATAGELTIGIPASLSSAISPIPSIAITANPMTITVPTKVIQTTATGRLTVSHNTPNGGTANLDITVRPPRPTAVVLTADTVPGSVAAAASVTFDQAGPATVILTSSDPTVATVPATVVRSGNTASFSIGTVQVSTPHTITISASLNAVSVSKTIVVRPGRLINVSPAATTVFAGDPFHVALIFDAPVASVPIAFSASDTSIKAGTATVSGTSFQATVQTTKTLTTAVNAVLTTTAAGVVKTTDVHVNPIRILQFSVSPASGSGGATLAATLSLSRAALQQQFVDFASSDTTVAIGPVGGVSFQIGEQLKIVTITIRGPQSATKTATITAKLHTNFIVSAATVSDTKTVTVTATP